MSLVYYKLYRSYNTEERQICRNQNIHWTGMSLVYYNLYRSIPIQVSLTNLEYYFLQTYFLPVIGLVDPEKLSPGDIVVGISS